MKPDANRYILYADDDQEDQEAMKDMINNVATDIALVCVNTGMEVLKYLDALQTGDYLPCLILLDLNMPQLDGMETLKRLKQHVTFKSLPVIIFSTAGRDGNVDRAKSEGAVDYIQKPFNLEKFKTIINNFIDHCEIVPEQKS